MDQLILSIFRALSNGVSMETLHDGTIAEGWSEEDFFLAFKAAENLHNASQVQEKELNKRPLPFGRKQ